MAQKLNMYTNDEIDSLSSYEHKPFAPDRRCVDILHKAAEAWDNLEDFRKMRCRCKNYLYKDQWSDTVEYNGKRISEKKYIEMQGLPALQNNLIGKSVRTLLGVRRQSNSVPLAVATDSAESKYGDVISTLLLQNMRLSDRKETDSRMFEEFCLSGLAAYKTVYAYRDGREDVFTDYVNPNFLFFQSGTDMSMRDIRFIGEIHDISFQELIIKFAHKDEDEKSLRDIYNYCKSSDNLHSSFQGTLINSAKIDNLDFFMPTEYGRCRVIEIWTKETRRAWWCHDRREADPYMIPYDEVGAIKEENDLRLEQNRVKDEQGNYVLDEQGNIQTFVPEEEVELIEYEWRVEDFWYYRFLSPLGHVLEEGVSPYKIDGSYFQPYTIKPYPYIDGEIHSFVENIIDQQRFVNHYVIMMDFCIKNAAKGVLAIDENSLTSQQTIADIAEQYVKTNGYILYTSKTGGQIPRSIQNSSVPAGMEYMITMQKNFVEEISGVQAAMQGKTATSGTSAALYQTQLSQASANVADLMETFNSFIREVSLKTIKEMKCFYSERKCVVISGEKLYYDPATMGAVEYDISISESTDTPAYREANNNLLMQLLSMGLISAQTMFKAGNFKNSEKILALMETDKQQAQQQQAQQQQAQQQNI